MLQKRKKEYVDGLLVALEASERSTSYEYMNYRDRTFSKLYILNLRLDLAPVSPNSLDPYSV